MCCQTVPLLEQSVASEWRWKYEEWWKRERVEEGAEEGAEVGAGVGVEAGGGSGSGSGPLPRPAIILNPQSWYTSRPSSVCLHLLLHLLRHLLRHLLLRIFYFSLCFTSASDSTYQTLHPPCPIGSTSCIVALQPQITTSVTTERGGIARAARHPQQPRCATLSPSRSKHHKIYFRVGP